MSEFTDHLTEIFADFAPIDIRRMFGGHGVFRDGLMFGLVADDVLYLKADDLTRAQFVEQGLEPFEYHKQGKSMQLSYHRAPEDIFEDPEQAMRWATLAFDAALRARKPAKKKPARKKAARK